MEYLYSFRVLLRRLCREGCGSYILNSQKCKEVEKAFLRERFPRH